MQGGGAGNRIPPRLEIVIPRRPQADVGIRISIRCVTRGRERETDFHAGALHIPGMIWNKGKALFCSAVPVSHLQNGQNHHGLEGEQGVGREIAA